MKERTLGLVALFLSVSLAGCSKEDVPATGDKNCAQTCDVSTSCLVGQVCTDGCCADVETCVPGQCEGGAFCDDDGACKDAATKCLEETTCVCHILGSASLLAAGATDDQATISLAGGSSLDLHTVLIATDSGAALPGTSFKYAVDQGSLFAVTESTLKANNGTAVGEAVLTATLDNAELNVSCKAALVNLGDAPSTGVRFHVFNDSTGEPIADAQVVVQNVDTSGYLTLPADDTGFRATPDSHGLVTFADVTTAFNVTVFAAGFNYLSVVGLDGSKDHDVALPLAASAKPPLVGGFTGQLDFKRYEDTVLGGQGRLLKAGIVSGSIPLQALLNANTDVLIGRIQDMATCEADVSTPGCYQVKIGTIVDQAAPLPGGIILGIGGESSGEQVYGNTKGDFNVVTVPGRRMAWSLGGEADLGDLADVVGEVAKFISCSCDETKDACDEGCDCDTACGINIDFGKVLDNVVPLLSQFATGVHGDLSLQGVPETDWNDYVGQAKYAERTSDARFPTLDGADPGPLALSHRLSVYTDFTVPALPADPVKNPDTDQNEPMEAMVVLTGVLSPGYGFVPLGLGAGLDCTKGDCLDRVANAENFDGMVNGGKVCFASADPKTDRCGPEMPSDGIIPAGHLAAFHALPHGGLESGRWLTLVLAIPVSGFLSGGSDSIRATALVKWDEEPATGAQTLTGQFAAFAQMPATVTSAARQYVTKADAGLHWVTFAVNEEDGDTGTARWNVYFPSTGGNFQAPPTPATGTWADPFTDGKDGAINVTHVGFKLVSGKTMEGFAANDGSSLVELTNHVEGLSLQNQNY